MKKVLNFLTDIYIKPTKAGTGIKVLFLVEIGLCSLESNKFNGLEYLLVFFRKE